MKAYKSLQIYNQVTEGLVRNVKINLSENELTVVKEKVGYATVQRLPAMICYIFIKTTVKIIHNSSSTLPKGGLNSPPLKSKSPITKETSSQMDILF